MIKTTTKPKLRFPKGHNIDPDNLAAKRYGTLEMCEIWGAERTFDFSLFVQAKSAEALSKLNPQIVPLEHSQEILDTVKKGNIDYDQIRDVEERTGHDIIAINTVLEKYVSHEAGAHINKAKTSADTTESAKALQLKKSLEVIVDSVENLRDVTLEKSLMWIDVPHMDTSHLYDALPTVAGRPLSHYAEMLQSGLELLKFVYDNSIVGKWADATGNHHSANALGVDGRKLQSVFCKELGIGEMKAPAQVPGLEFQADVVFSLARVSETVNNLASYVAWGRSDDVGIFVNANPRKKKGSSAMPHKDSKNGNPTAEEQMMSVTNMLGGMVATVLRNCQMPYARNLAASANSRANYETGFKMLDHSIRRMSSVMYWLDINEERSKERVERSLGCPTSQQVMTYLTDQRRVNQPMTRSYAHDLMGGLATEAWNEKVPFVDKVLGCSEVRERLDEETIKDLTNPQKYVGESKCIVEKVYDSFHGQKTL